MSSVNIHGELFSADEVKEAARKALRVKAEFEDELEADEERPLAVREHTARERLRKLGYAVRKDRAQSWSIDHQNGYLLTDTGGSTVVAGEGFSLTIDDLEKMARREMRIERGF